MSDSVGNIVSSIHAWAPKESALSYDNVGLQIGRRDAPVVRGIVALDLTPQIVQEAIEKGANLIVTHHPVIFKALSHITDTTLVSSMALTLAEHRIALIAAHTNLDAARGGVSFHLAKTLGLEQVDFLEGMEDVVRKLTVFVPPEFAEAVREAAHEAGGGQIGAYSDCSFSVGGTGQFRPTSSANPFIGTTGGPIERLHEVRIEMVVESWKIDEVLSAIKQVHPYEEVAYDVTAVSGRSRNVGIGAVGNLPAPVSLAQFLSNSAVALSTEALRYAGDANKTISRVAVCGGSGGEFIPAAIRSGADVFVTGDLSYHRFFDVLDVHGEAKMALIDAGHYETEQGTEDLLLDHLRHSFDSIEWSKTQFRSSPSHIWTKKQT
ncbi:Nif3-like dinuclear metal center hexameric protein [bacterium]|nr:Nif3-like dinuclear metal center hexameric protein [bacterium]